MLRHASGSPSRAASRMSNQIGSSGSKRPSSARSSAHARPARMARRGSPCCKAASSFSPGDARTSTASTPTTRVGSRSRATCRATAVATSREAAKAAPCKRNQDRSAARATTRSAKSRPSAPGSAVTSSVSHCAVDGTRVINSSTSSGASLHQDQRAAPNPADGTRDAFSKPIQMASDHAGSEVPGLASRQIFANSSGQTLTNGRSAAHRATAAHKVAGWLNDAMSRLRRLRICTGVMWATARASSCTTRAFTAAPALGSGDSRAIRRARATSSSAAGFRARRQLKAALQQHERP